MREALQLAEQAAMVNEVPVGAVLVRNDEIIGQGYNQCIALNDCSAHAEIMALRDAGANTKDYRFNDCTLYCTLEPCTMCAGALLHARIARCVYAAEDPAAGAAGSVLDVLDMPEFNHQVQINRGVLAEPAATLLQEFFKVKR